MFIVNTVQKTINNQLFNRNSLKEFQKLNNSLVKKVLNFCPFDVFYDVVYDVF